MPTAAAASERIDLHQVVAGSGGNEATAVPWPWQRAAAWVGHGNYQMFVPTCYYGEIGWFLTFLD